MHISAFLFGPIRSSKLEGRVASRKATNKAPSRDQVARSKQLNELLLRRPSNPTPDQASTSASTSTSHSPPLNEATSYASLTNVNFVECLERDVEETTKYIFVDQNGKTESQRNTSPKSIASLDGYKGTTLIINTSSSPLRLRTECTNKLDEPMDPNSVTPQPVTSSFVGAPPNSAPLHPPTPHYNQIPAYEYIQHAGEGPQPQYHLYEPPHPGSQSYYVTTGYPAEYDTNTRYVVEQQHPVGYYAPNGYVQPSTSNAYHQIGYPPHGSIVYPNSAPPYDQRPQAQIPPRHFVDQKGYPIVNRNVVQLVEMPKGPVQTSDQPNSVEPKGKATKKKSIAPTHTITAVPISLNNEVDNKNDIKKLFKCNDCGKCVSSSRNLTRHSASCKLKKKSGDEAGGSVQSKSSSSSLGSPPKSKASTSKATTSKASISKSTTPKKTKQAKPQSIEVVTPSNAIQLHPNQPSNQVLHPHQSVQHPSQPSNQILHPNNQSHPTQLPHQSHQYYSQPLDGVIYHGHPVHPSHHFVHPPHTALPHSHSQPAFDYPSTGIQTGLHSAPPTMNNFQYTSLPSSAQGPSTFEAQRPYGEPMNNPVYTYNAAPVDSFIDNSIDEMIHNPLAYLGTDYESNSSADRSLHENSDFRHSTSFQNGPSSQPSTQPKANIAGPSDKSKGRKTNGRKNMEPTPYMCSSCSKYMCSQRSLRRHRSTCKLYLQTTPDLTNEEKQMIAQNNENKCDKCGKVLQSPSNLRRHVVSCTQRSEDESKPPTSSSLQSNNSPTRNPTIIEHLTSQVVTTIDPSGQPKRLMPPPEAQQSSIASACYTQQIHHPTDPFTSFYAGQNVTIGEHLRHHYKPPGSVSPSTTTQKQPSPHSKRPPILGRKSSLQNSDISDQLEELNEQSATCPSSGHILSPSLPEFHSRSAPPTDIVPKGSIKKEIKVESAESIRKSEQVADVINSVVEKIRRQNVADMHHQDVVPVIGKRTNNSAGPTPPKIKKTEQTSKANSTKPLASIITTQSLQASNHQLQPSPRAYNPAQGQQMIVQQSSQIQVPLVTAEQEPTEEDKVVARYMCPECFKFYACRKNVKAHRINTHSITEAQADSNVAKRVKVNSSGYILTPGFERENALLQQRSSTESIKPTIAKTTSQPKKRNSTASNGESKTKKTANKPAPIPIPNGQPHSSEHTSPQLQSAHFYHNSNGPNGLHPTTSISPQYEQLQPVPINPFSSQQHLYSPNVQHDYNPSSFIQSNDLELWDQIKSRVDVPYERSMSTKDDEIDVARIAADLKRSAESEVQQNITIQKVSTNGGEFSSDFMSVETKTAVEPKTTVETNTAVEPKTTVELAEADSTFCEEDTGLNPTTQSSDSKQPSIQSVDTDQNPIDEKVKKEDDIESKSPANQEFTSNLHPIDTDNTVKVEFQSS